MKKFSYRYLLVGLLVCLGSSGCAAFSGGNLKELENFPAAPEAPINAYINMTWNHYENGVRKPEPDLIKAEEAMISALKVFKETGFFSKVSSFMADPDVQIKVLIQYKYEGPAQAGSTFFILTLGLIPIHGTNHFVMDVEATNLKTGLSRSYHLEDSVNVYGQTLLILIAPFNWAPSVRQNVLENMFKHLAVNMHEDGLLKTVQ